MKDRVLVTGGTGFIGTQTIPLLVKSGLDVYVISRKEINDSPYIHYIYSDIFNYDKIFGVCQAIKPKYLLHFAWLSTGLFEDTINFEFLSSSLNLLKAFNQAGGQRVIISGTYAEYGNSSDILSEKDETNPHSIYGFCKDNLRKISETYCRLNNISLGWGRIFSAYGKENDKRRLTSDVIEHLYNNEEVIIRSGKLIRDYIYVKDVAASFSKFLQSDVQGIVNICSGTGTSIKDFVLNIAKVLGKENLVKFVDDPGNQQRTVIGDSTRLRNEVGYNPAYSLETGIKETIKLYFN